MGEKEMTLEQCEVLLKEISSQIEELLTKRENLLIQWNKAFDKQTDNITRCEYERNGDSFWLYLINGEYKLEVCNIYKGDLDKSADELYHRIETSIIIHNVKNRREELTDIQTNLVLGKVAEIRNSLIDQKDN